MVAQYGGNGCEKRGVLTRWMAKKEGKDRRVQDPSSIWTGNFALLCLASLSLLVCAQVLLPTLPLYVLKIGGTQRDVGFVMGAYTIGATIMRTLAGWLSDRYGRKRVMISGLVMMAAVTVVYRAADNVLFVGTIRVFTAFSTALPAPPWALLWLTTCLPPAWPRDSAISA